MKRLILALILAAVASVMASAQEKDLNVSRFFSEKFASSPGVTVVRMSGNPDKWDGIATYASVSVAGDGRLADEMAAAVKKDGAGAEQKETAYKEGRLSLGFYSLGKKKGRQLYLFYLDRRHAGVEKTTLVYISGDLSPEEVKRLISKKK